MPHNTLKYLFSETAKEEEKFLPAPFWGDGRREMKRHHQSILGLISCHIYLVPLQFLLCPRFPNMNALIPPEQCLLVCTVMLAPYLETEPPSDACMGACSWFEGGRSQPGLQAGRLQHSGALAVLESCMSGPSEHDWSDPLGFATRSAITKCEREVARVTTGATGKLSSDKNLFKCIKRTSMIYY